MDEANMEADGGQQERQAKNEKLWKAYPPETYRNTIAELVHFSSKTVNSNAALAGVRLASDDALDAPYVSARTLMARGVSLSLDYGKGGAAVALDPNTGEVLAMASYPTYDLANYNKNYASIQNVSPSRTP